MIKSKLIIYSISSLIILLPCAYLIYVFAWEGFFTWLMYTIYYNPKTNSVDFTSLLLATIDLGLRTLILTTLFVIIVKYNIENIKKFKRQDDYKYELSNKKVVALITYTIFLVLAYIYKVCIDEIENLCSITSVINYIKNFDWRNMFIWGVPLLLEVLCITLLIIKSIKILKAKKETATKKIEIA